MPPQQRPRRHEETLTASPWQASGRGTQKGPVERSEAGPIDLPPQHVQLVAEHDNFEILAGLVLSLRDQQPE